MTRPPSRRRARRFASAIAVSVAGWTLLHAAPPAKFYPDDPISRDAESQDASGAASFELPLYLDLLIDSFGMPGDKTHPSPRAANVNTVDEVPDSGWFTNRVLPGVLTREQLERGAADGPPPDARAWTIVGGKSGGVSPGFQAQDASGETWFISFDGVGNDEAGTGAIMVASRIFHALGYWQVDNRLTRLDPASLTIKPGATIRGRNGRRRPFTARDLEKVLRRCARSADGTYRVAAARLVRGRPIGNFRYYGVRTDDPNDLVPHEHRRELRALQVFGAWTNLIDLKGGNTLDTVVEQRGHGVLRHYLQDVGSTFGTGAIGPRDWDDGWEFLFEADLLWRRVLTFGLAPPTWATVEYDEVPGVGRFEAVAFDPRAWRPRTPVAALRHLRADDAFWAARRVMAFSDEMIRTCVKGGQYSYPQAAEHLARTLMARRDTIGRIYYSQINPLVDFALSPTGVLTFRNPSVDAGFAAAPRDGYRAAWAGFDNVTGEHRPWGESRGPNALQAPMALPLDPGAFVSAEVGAVGSADPAWERPVRVYFRRDGERWRLVGLER